MNKKLITYIGLLPIFVLIQVLILNEILFFSYINPYLYLFLIINFPLNGSKWFLLIYAFVLGFLIDLFSGTLGFHSTATVMIAFFRKSISKITIPHNIIGDNEKITLNKIGSKSFITFSLLIIFLHHTCLFLLEHLNFNIKILGKILASSFITLILILILDLFNSTKK